MLSLRGRAPVRYAASLSRSFSIRAKGNLPKRMSNPRGMQRSMTECNPIGQSLPIDCVRSALTGQCRLDSLPWDEPAKTLAELNERAGSVAGNSADWNQS